MADFTPGQIRDLLAHFGIADDPVAVLSIAGIDGINDIGVYDDRFYHSIGGEIRSYRGNVDPSKQQFRMATLARMRVFHWRPGIHGLSKPANRRYAAFVQAEAVTVNRHGVGADTGLFGINHHKGGVNGTSSLGCQTYPADVWLEARSRLYDALGASVSKIENREGGGSPFPYVVVPLENAVSILRHRGLSEETTAHTIPIAPTWTIRLRGENGEPDEVYSRAVNIAGRVFVPVRDFCVVALDCAADSAPLEWRDGLEGEDDEPILYIKGVPVKEVSEIDDRAYVWIHEVANALGYRININAAAKNLILKKV